jgi:two-component system, OmpR family, KDP operon response regulator KdpE
VGDTVATADNRILVVDDEPLVCTMLCDVLSALGYGVQSAASGAEALSLVPTFAPGVVLLDLTMPGMPGMEVLTHLRREYPQLPVVMMSGNQDAEAKRRALEAGAFDYVTKPFSLAILKVVVKAAIVGGSRC